VKRAPVRRARAVARSNIALAKYWGKCDVRLNLPAVPSVSMTLDGLVTETTVAFDGRLRGDRVSIDGAAAAPGPRRRVVELLDRVRAAADLPLPARVESASSFPAASGLASSASGFAALAAAATVAAGLPYRPRTVSRLARRSSASAARSVYGGYAKLPAGTPGDDRLAARQLWDEHHWDVRLVVAVTTEAKKSVGSTEGMERSRQTSPCYSSWLEHAPRLTRVVERALRSRDLDRLGAAMEQSTFTFHACAMSSDPAVVYFRPATLAALSTVRGLRDRGVSAWATMDAGPHVKVLCRAADAPRVARALKRTEGVLRTITARAGAGVEVA
jgi:diphosphomevalonate decarboxylase